MFLARLSDIEKKSFFVIAKCLANSHKGISSDEDLLLRAFMAEMGMVEEPTGISLEGAIENITLPSSRRIVLLELMLIALIDDDFSHEEKSLVDNVLEKFGLSATEIDRASNWAMSFSSLIKTGTRFIERF